MYKVNKEIDSKYGNIISINTEDIGEFELPFDAFKEAKSIKKQWITSGKIRFLVNAQIMTTKQVEFWSYKEYKGLSKCNMCPTILNNKTIYTNPHCGIKLFCSQSCADKSYEEYLETLNDEEECDYL